jgi:hypothetical protein
METIANMSKKLRGVKSRVNLAQCAKRDLYGQSDRLAKQERMS